MSDEPMCCRERFIEQAVEDCLRERQNERQCTNVLNESEHGTREMNEVHMSLHEICTIMKFSSGELEEMGGHLTLSRMPGPLAYGQQVVVNLYRVRPRY